MRKRLFTAASLIGALVLGACGESGYQYIESDDERVFAKIPDDWQVMSEGLVDFALRPEDASQFQLLPGDDTLPWRAQFTSDPGGDVVPEELFGYLDVQPVDARMRETLSIDRLLDVGEGGRALVGPIPIRLGELEGFRLRFSGAGDNPMTNDRLVLTDPRNTVLYVMQLGCNQDCFDANFEAIDEIMTTFTVEQ